MTVEDHKERRGGKRSRLRDAVRGKTRRLRGRQASPPPPPPLLPPHHQGSRPEEPTAAGHNHHGGVLRQSSQLHLSTDVMEADETSIFERPGPVVTFIVVIAVLFILIIAWFIAHEPVP